MKKLTLLGLFAISVAAINGVAQDAGPNLVTNGSFETGDFTGWTAHSCTGDCYDAAWVIEQDNAYSGTWSAANPCVDAPCNDPVNGSYLAQTLATDPSQLYSLTFAYNAYSGPTTQLNVYWNGTLIDSLVNLQPGYNVYTISGLTPGASGTVLEFTGRNDPSAIFLDAISVQATGPGNYIGAFYSSTAPQTCPNGLSDTCSANGTVGNVNAPTFVVANNGAVPITNGVLSLAGGDSYQVPSIPANSFIIIEPGVSNDGQTHPQGGFFATTGTPYASGDLGPNASNTQFTFTGQQNGSQIQALDVCGSIASPTFTPACTAGPSNDSAAQSTNFLGLNHTGCANCFGPAVVARLTGVVAGGSPSSSVMITSGAPPATGTVGIAYGPFTVTASGGSGTYQYSASGLPGVTIDSATGVLSGMPTTPGVDSLTIMAADANNLSSTISQTYTVTVAYPPLMITSAAPPAYGAINQTYNASTSPFTLTATGGSGVFTWSVSGVPGVTVNSSTGVLGGSPTVGGSLTLRVTLANASSPSQMISMSYPLSVLEITSGAPPATGTVGVPYGPFTATAAGGTGNYLWGLGGVPGLMIGAGTGVVSGSPTALISGLTVTVTDNTTHLSVSQSYPVTIAGAALVISTTTLPAGVENQPYSATLGGSGGSGNYNWAISGVPGLTVNASSGAIGGKPMAGGAQTLTVTLTDSSNPSATPATKQFPIAITFVPLRITSGGALGGFAPGASVAATFTATGGNTPYTWTATNTPTGLALGATTGQLMGAAPTKPGNYTFPLTVTDAETPSASDSTTVSFSVIGFTNPATLPSGSTATPYTLTFLGAGGTPPYTFSSAAPPAGLMVAASGLMSGTPARAGTVTFPVQITDSHQISVQSSFTLTVGSGPQPVQVTGLALPDGTATASYSQTLQAEAGTPPYTWAVIGGSLPQGLVLSGAGTISGTPTAPGLATFTARATDSSGGFASGVFTITVDPAPLQVTSAALPNAIAGLPYGAQPINATGGYPPYTFALTQGTLPAPLTFTNGQVNSGVPTSAGPSSFSVTVTDSTGNTASGAFTLLVEATQPDLILSQGSVSFAIVAGQSTLPPVANVTVGSSVADPLHYSVQMNPVVNWLDVTPNADTLGTAGGAPVMIALDPTNAPMLGVGTYQTTVTLTCPPFTCAASHNVGVTVVVTAPAPQLSLGTSLLSFTATGNGSQTMAQPLKLQNAGGGTITVQSVTAPDPWVTFVPGTIPGTLTAGQSASVGVIADTTQLSGPGYYQSTITVTTDAGSVTVPVTLLIAANATMTLNPAGSQFNTVAGNLPGIANGSFLVSVSGNSTVSWTAAVTTTPAPAWLTLNTSTGQSGSTSPGTVTFTINGAAAGLPAQVYYATIEVTATGAGVVDPVQDYRVVLNVAAAGNITVPDPDPQGLIFITEVGGAALPAQVVTVNASSPGVAYYAQTDGSAWLAVSPASGMTSAGSAAQSNVSVNATGLAPGVYRGGVNYSIAGQVRTVNATLIVTAAGAAPSAISGVTGKAAGGCTPSQVIPTQTGLVNNFSLPTAWPTPLEIRVMDDCGHAVTNGQVVTTFSNGDPPLVLPPAGVSAGMYSGTWTPRATASQVTITAQASALGLKPAAVAITGQVTRNGAPVLNAGGTLNAFVPVLGGPLAPGMIVQIYGSNLASQTVAGSTIPLANSLNNTSVIIGGQEAPLYFVSPGQINAQVPFGLTPGMSYQVIVNANGALSTPNAIQLAGDAPGVAVYAGGGAIAEHADGTLVTEASPAVPGEAVVFFASGLGATDNPVTTGAASPGSPLARPTDQPTLTLNGANVPVAFAGLTPTLVGLYQVNFNVPANAPNGDLQLVLTQSGGSVSTILPVHN